MVENKQSAGPLILISLISMGVAGAVVYLLAEPRIDRSTVNNVAYICAAGPLLIATILAVFAGLAWLDGRRHARRREDEAMRGDVIYQRQQMASQQATDLAIMRQMVQLVEHGARAQLTAARTQNELARGALLQPPADESAYWAIPAEWAEIDD